MWTESGRTCRINYTHELLDKLTDYRVELAREICERGVVFGHGGDDYGIQRGPLLSLSTWREFIKPRLARIYGVYKEYGLPVLHHSCGDCSIFIEDLLEIGVDALHPIQASHFVIPFMNIVINFLNK